MPQAADSKYPQNDWGGGNSMICVTLSCLFRACLGVGFFAILCLRLRFASVFAFVLAFAFLRSCLRLRACVLVLVSIERVMEIGLASDGQASTMGVRSICVRILGYRFRLTSVVSDWFAGRGVWLRHLGDLV